MHEARNTEATTDGYGGVSWKKRSELDGLRAVLDDGDVNGKKNAFIDAIHRRAIASVLDRTKNVARALDFGCGVGRLIPLLCKYAGEVFGVDRTPGMLEVARENLSISPDRLRLWENGPLPFDPQTFGVILSVYVFSCVPDTDVADGLMQLRRVIEPDGTLIMLEQIAPNRGLTRGYYAQHLRAAGFNVTSMRAVRGGSSRLVGMISKPWFPSRFINAAAAIEVAVAPYERHRDWDYYDCVITSRPIT